jgi:hypothetical protein
MYSRLLSDYLRKYGLLYQTASTLTFAAYMLTQHPDIARRLREEILNKIGHGRPTFEQMKEMKYLRAFINGVLNFLFHIHPSDIMRNRNPEALSSCVRIWAQFVVIYLTSHAPVQSSES